MSKKLYLAGCAICVTSLLANSAVADGNFYLELKSGISKPNRLKGDMGHFTIKKSPVIEMAAGYNINHNLAVGVSLAYHPKHKIELYSAVELGGGDITNVYHKADVKTLVTMLNAHINMIEYNGFTPYMGFGVGVARNKFSGSSVYTDYDPVNDVSLSGTNFFNYKVQGATRVSLAWRLVAGLRKKITDNCEILFEYNYAKLGKIKNSSKIVMYDGNVNYEPVQKSTLGANNTLLLGMRYSF